MNNYSISLLILDWKVFIWMLSKLMSFKTNVFRSKAWDYKGSHVRDF